MAVTLSLVRREETNILEDTFLLGGMLLSGGTVENVLHFHAPLTLCDIQLATIQNLQ